MDDATLTIPNEPVAPAEYWETRKDMMYYKYIRVLVRAFAADARSLIDVGSRNTPLVEEFDWIPRRVALDLGRVYRSENVEGIQCDFLTYVPEQRYDFALCFQVLEHIPDVSRFARHLLQVADSVLVSVPFMWRKGGNPYHVHDPVSLENVIEWMGRKPNYHIIVTEPFAKNQRLIAYFHTRTSTFSLAAVRERVRNGYRS